jgi:hypothetical protein
MLIDRIRNREQRAQALINLATNVMEKGDKKTAAALLGDARASLPDAPESYGHVSLLLSIAGTYSQIDPSRGIQIMNEIAALLDRLIPAAETLQGFDMPVTFRDGEILMEPYSQLSSTMAQFAEQVGSLAISDYAAAVSAAGTAGRSELRIMTNLSIASKILGQAGPNAQGMPVSGRAFTQLRRGFIEFGGAFNGNIVFDSRD